MKNIKLIEPSVKYYSNFINAINNYNENSEDRYKDLNDNSSKGNPYRIYERNLETYDSTKRLSLQDKNKLIFANWSTLTCILSHRDNLFVES